MTTTRPFCLALAASAVLFAASPASADLMWQEQQLLVAPDPGPMGMDAFGAAVAVSGSTLVVGAPTHGEVGAAYVFVRTGTGWALQQELENTTPGNYPNAAWAYTLYGSTWTLQGTLEDGVAMPDNLGASVAVSGDTALVGAPGNAGAAYVFARSGGAWALQQILPALDGASIFGRRGKG